MKVEDRITALESAYDQLIGALKMKVDQDEVDPEKRKAAMALYRLAQEDSRKIFDELAELKGLTLVSLEDADELEEFKAQNRSSGLSPEQRMRK